MATSGKPSRGALQPALLVAVVTVALLLGTSTAQAVQSPPVAIVTLNVTNLLTTAITLDFSTNLVGVAGFRVSAVVGPLESKQIPVNVPSATGLGSSATITVVGVVYGLGTDLTTRILAQTGEVQIKVSSPCPDQQPGLLVSADLPAGSGTTVSCTGPPISSN